MSIAQMIHNEIAKIPLGEPFTVRKLKTFGNWPTVQRSLSRMTKSGEIKRISKGVYAKPKMFRNYEIVKTGRLLIDCIENTTNETIVTSGGHATNLLGISTQSQLVELYYWTGRSKIINVNGKLLKFLHINKKFANKSHPLLELFLSSAYFLGKNLFTVENLKKAELRLGKENVLELKPYLPEMPIWVMLVFQEYFEGINNG